MGSSTLNGADYGSLTLGQDQRTIPTLQLGHANSVDGKLQTDLRMARS
jgi:hypothetical protein